MKSKKVRSLVAIVSGVLIISCLAGCSKNDGKPQADKQEAQQENVIDNGDIGTQKPQTLDDIPADVSDESSESDSYDQPASGGASFK